MSTLSKVFVVLVCALALINMGVTATLFAQRVDWKDKFVKEVYYHYQTQQVKNGEIADLDLQRQSLVDYNKMLEEKNRLLEKENSSKSEELTNLQKQFNEVDKNFKQLNSSVDVFVRQLDVQMTLVQEMTAKVEEYRNKLARAVSERSTATQELQYARQESEVLQKSLAALEESHIALAREKQRLEEIVKASVERGVDMGSITPKKTLEAKVMAVDAGLGLVIMSIGKDDGVLEGGEFTVYRGGQFVAKLVIERVDRKHAVGRIVLKKDDPRVSDDVSNAMIISTFKSNP